jgi:amino acid transporter
VSTPANPLPPPAGEPRLERGIGITQATAINMSNMVGIGPFITIPALMTTLGGPQAMLGWLVALIVALADGLVWSELGAALPGSGGSYAYLREGFGRERWGRLMSFLFIFQFLFSGPLEIASGFIGFGMYLHFIWTGGGDLALKLAVAFAGLLTVFLLYRPIRNIGRIMVAMWLGMLITVAAVIVTGAMHFDPKLAFDFPPGAWKLTGDFWFGLGAASAIGMYDYLGYYNICHLGEEVREPGRVIPRSVLISLVAVALLYVGINFAIIGIVPWREFVPPPGTPLADPPPPVVSMMMEKIWGNDVAKIFTVLVLWTALASCVALLLGYSRIPYAAARDGNFFKPFSRLHPAGAFPHVSLVVVGLLAVVFTFLPLMTVIAALLTTRIVVQFGGQIVALMVLRKTRPDLVRPFKMWLYPLPAFIALVGWLFLLVTTRPAMLLACGAGVLVLGVLAFLGLAKAARRWPFAGA